MKKVLFIAVVFCVILFAGCKKTCHCVTKQSFPGEEPIVTTTTLTIDKGKCSDMNASQTSSFDGEVVSQTVECTQE